MIASSRTKLDALCRILQNTTNNAIILLVQAYSNPSLASRDEERQKNAYSSLSQHVALVFEMENNCITNYTDNLLALEALANDSSCSEMKQYVYKQIANFYLTQLRESFGSAFSKQQSQRFALLSFMDIKRLQTEVDALFDRPIVNAQMATMVDLQSNIQDIRDAKGDMKKNFIQRNYFFIQNATFVLGMTLCVGVMLGGLLGAVFATTPAAGLLAYICAVVVGPIIGGLTIELCSVLFDQNKEYKDKVNNALKPLIEAKENVVNTLISNSLDPWVRNYNQGFVVSENSRKNQHGDDSKQSVEPPPPYTSSNAAARFFSEKPTAPQGSSTEVFSLSLN